MIKLYNFDELKPEEILNRDIRAEKNVEDVVDGIIADVRARGDEALKDYALKFDGAVIENLQVTQEEIDEAFAGMDPYFLETLRQAAENIEQFHRQQEQQHLPAGAGGLHAQQALHQHPGRIQRAVPKINSKRALSQEVHRTVKRRAVVLPGVSRQYQWRVDHKRLHPPLIFHPVTGKRPANRRQADQRQCKRRILCPARDVGRNLCQHHAQE